MVNPPSGTVIVSLIGARLSFRFIRPALSLALISSTVVVLLIRCMAITRNA